LPLEPRLEASALYPPRLVADGSLVWDGGVNVFHSLRFGSPVRVADDCSERLREDDALGGRSVRELSGRVVLLLGAEDVRVPWFPTLPLAELFISRPEAAVPALGFPPAADTDDAPRDSMVAPLRPPAVTGLT